MQAWGSIAGLVMSTAAVLFTGLLFRHEIRVRREERRDNEAAQARLIIATIAEVVKEGGRVVGAELTVVNHSDAPVFDVYLYVTNWQLEHKGMFKGSSSRPIEILQPGETGYGRVVFDQSWLPPRARRSYMWAAVSFFDAAGLNWDRKGSEHPARIIDPFDLQPGLLGLAWQYLWPLSGAVSWMRKWHQNIRRKVESHMRGKVFEREQGHRLTGQATPTIAPTHAGGALGRGGGQAAD